MPGNYPEENIQQRKINNVLSANQQEQTAWPFYLLNSLYFSAPLGIRCAIANSFNGVQMACTKHRRSVKLITAALTARRSNSHSIQTVWPRSTRGRQMLPHALKRPPGVSDNPDQTSHYHIWDYNVRDSCDPELVLYHSKRETLRWTTNPKWSESRPKELTT
jgi:hypothetical protein